MSVGCQFNKDVSLVLSAMRFQAIVGDQGIRRIQMLYGDHWRRSINILSSLPLSISCRLPIECVHKIGLDDSSLSVNVADKHNPESLTESVVVLVWAKTA